MEVLIITYGIAWLLLLSFSLYMQFTEKEKIFRRDVWLVWLLLFAFAPIILLGLLLSIPVYYIWGSTGELYCFTERERRTGKRKGTGYEKTGCGEF